MGRRYNNNSRLSMPHLQKVHGSGHGFSLVLHIFYDAAVQRVAFSGAEVVSRSPLPRKAERKLPIGGCSSFVLHSHETRTYGGRACGYWESIRGYAISVGESLMSKARA